MSLIRRIAILLPLLLLGACGEPLPLQQAIAENTRAIQQAMEEKDRSGVLDHLSVEFSANDQLDREAVGVMLLRHFIAHRNITVSILDSSISPHPGYANLAEAHYSVIITGAENLLPERARVTQVDALWRLEDGEWRLYEIRWE